MTVAQCLNQQPYQSTQAPGTRDVRIRLFVLPSLRALSPFINLYTRYTSETSLLTPFIAGLVDLLDGPHAPCECTLSMDCPRALLTSLMNFGGLYPRSLD